MPAAWLLFPRQRVRRRACSPRKGWARSPRCRPFTAMAGAWPGTTLTGRRCASRRAAPRRSRNTPGWPGSALGDLGLVHLRWATPGLGIGHPNSHPFRFGPYTFAHNGAIHPQDRLGEMLPAEWEAAARRDDRQRALPAAHHVAAGRTARRHDRGGRRHGGQHRGALRGQQPQRDAALASEDVRDLLARPGPDSRRPSCGSGAWPARPRRSPGTSTLPAWPPPDAVVVASSGLAPARLDHGAEPQRARGGPGHARRRRRSHWSRHRGRLPGG